MKYLLFYTPPDEQTIRSSSKYLGYNLPSEICYRIQVEKDTIVDENKLYWLISPNPLSLSVYKESNLDGRTIEIGPHPWQQSSFCSNALSVLSSAGMEGFIRIEKQRKYKIDNKDNRSDEQLLSLLGDPMTESIYTSETSWESCNERSPFTIIDVLNDPNALKNANEQLGLAFDSNDILYYETLYRDQLKRNPTDVELSDLANADSEHSRHWFFRGKLIPEDGEPIDESLMETIKKTLDHSNKNNLIAFSDNSSAIHGLGKVSVLAPSLPSEPSPYTETTKNRHIVYTAETHNFPTAVCPFEGAATGAGGRMRDNHSTGRGAYQTAGVAGYSFGNLHLQDYPLEWEDPSYEYPSNFAHPKNVIIGASNGASDYSNKFGEPIICGYSRSFGLTVDNKRIEYLKPIMFSGGIGSIDDESVKKNACEEGMMVAKIGGPAYRIGLGGGAASSVSVQGSRKDGFDFCAVQRGDAQMGHKLNRLVRVCAEMGEKNPIESIHDQGAGGNGNVLKEIVEGCGAIIDADSFILGDNTLSVRELWTAEYQENDAILVRKENLDVIEKISKRENCIFSVVGEATKDRRFILNDYNTSTTSTDHKPVDMDLELLEQRPKKIFHVKESHLDLPNLKIGLVSLKEALKRVLRLPSVSSKRYLTNKADRSVTGLIAQQQCVGPLQTPLADVAVVATSFLDTIGAALSVGEQPIKMLVNTQYGVEMTLAETLTNIVFAPISDIKDIKLSGNWMWSRDDDGGRMAKAVSYLADALSQVGIAIDGGKDSLSMRAATTSGHVTAPGTLVLSAYAPCVDIRRVVTPDLKEIQSETVLVYLRMDGGKDFNLGGTAVAQVYSQVGNESTKIHSWKTFTKSFNLIQELIRKGEILAGHDVSDGGVITSLLEMAFAGNVGVNVRFSSDRDVLETLFNESSALLLQVTSTTFDEIRSRLADDTTVIKIADIDKEIRLNAKVIVHFNEDIILNETVSDLREEWEETSDKLDLMQTTANCVYEAHQVRRRFTRFPSNINFCYSMPSIRLKDASRILILREEGSNGDREMAAAFYMAGLTPIDTTTNDLLDCPSLLSTANGIAFVGGFSYSDVLGSAKGWAARIKFNERLSKDMKKWREREDTFSIGICNGCQLMTLLGWVGEIDGKPSVFMERNLSGKYESSYVAVRIRATNSIFTKGMEESVLGVWSAHGEGRFSYRDAISSHSHSISMQYVNEHSIPTQEYPWNPNGSEDGVAAITSQDGRHLAIMPHPERTFLQWQQPIGERKEGGPSPWIKLFTNATQWLQQQ